jgi:GMP synthase (glutamine-hydrolysing)
VWQFPVVLIPLAKKHTFGNTVVLRPIESIDGMTAQFSSLPVGIWRELAEELIEHKSIDGVLLDVTHKPPATIEWE